MFDPKRQDVVAARDKQFCVSKDQIAKHRCRELGFEVPKVSHPRSMDDAGRQWTDEGEDKRTRRQ